MLQRLKPSQPTLSVEHSRASLETDDNIRRARLAAVQDRIKSAALVARQKWGRYRG